MLITKAVYELKRYDGEHALVTMCCGGGLGTGTLAAAETRSRDYLGARQ